LEFSCVIDFYAFPFAEVSKRAGLQAIRYLALEESVIEALRFGIIFQRH